MTNKEAMLERHSVRKYLHKEIPVDLRKKINQLITDANADSMQKFEVFYDEPKAFKSFLKTYGMFHGVENYIALVGRREEALGYFGERIVLELTKLGLQSCFVGLTFDKKCVNVNLAKGEHLFGVIAFGYGVNKGHMHKSKKIEDVLTIQGKAPEFIEEAVHAMLLAPTAMNRQNFHVYVENGEVTIKEAKKFPYSLMDLGIVRYHYDCAMEEYHSKK